MTIHDFLYNLSTFDGRAYKQKELYANLILKPNQSIKELQKILSCNSKNFKQLYDNLLKKGLKIEPIDEIEEDLKNRISNIEKEQNAKITIQKENEPEKLEKPLIELFDEDPFSYLKNEITPDGFSLKAGKHLNKLIPRYMFLSRLERKNQIKEKFNYSDEEIEYIFNNILKDFEPLSIGF